MFRLKSFECDVKEHTETDELCHLSLEKCCFTIITTARHPAGLAGTESTLQHF